MGVIKFTKFNENAKLPVGNYPNAGLDIYLCFDEEYKIIQPHTTELLSTGIGSIVEEGYYLQIQERGSTGSKGIKYSAGVIDSNYRGEIFLATTNSNNKPLLIIKESAYNSLDDVARKLVDDAYIVYMYEKALFQGIIHKVHNFGVEYIPLVEFNSNITERGTGKLGSSGN